MSRYRLLPTPEQEAVLRGHCAHARYVWNLAVEQHAHWRPGRKSAPGYLEQCRQLTQARAEHPWLAKTSTDIARRFDLATSVADTVPVANWMHVEDGMITRIRVAFDARGIAGGQKK